MTLKRLITSSNKLQSIPKRNLTRLTTSTTKRLRPCLQRRLKSQPRKTQQSSSLEPTAESTQPLRVRLRQTTTQKSWTNCVSRSSTSNEQSSLSTQMLKIGVPSSSTRSSRAADLSNAFTTRKEIEESASHSGCY